MRHLIPQAKIDPSIQTDVVIDLVCCHSKEFLINYTQPDTPRTIILASRGGGGGVGEIISNQLI